MIANAVKIPAKLDIQNIHIYTLMYVYRTVRKKTSGSIGAQIYFCTTTNIISSLNSHVINGLLNAFVPKKFVQDVRRFYEQFHKNTTKFILLPMKINDTSDFTGPAVSAFVPVHNLLIAASSEYTIKNLRDFLSCLGQTF